MQQAIATQRTKSNTNPFGRWRLAGKLAESRWFSVYLAAPAICDPDWQPDYVIKCVRSELARDKRALQLLAREAQVGRDVTHPHLATILDAELENDRPFVVQPYYEGATVRRLLSSGALPIARALWITRQVAQALSAMHQGNWSHGDIKPENVVVSPSGHATLIDLGFARRVHSQVARRADIALQTTLAYAAPELFQPHFPATTASDIYALGIMLYEMLCGRHPFGADDPSEIARQHLRSELTEIRRFNALVPPDVSRLVTQMTAKNHEQRPAANELVKQLVGCEISCFALR